MATTTTNYGLTKPAYSDTADIAVVNGNMDKIDTALGGIDNGIAIVSNNNTHAAVSKGQYVYVRGHGTLAEGMYKAKAAIAANAALSTTNVESAVMGTDLAAVSDQTANINTAVATPTASSKCSLHSGFQGKKSANVVVLNGVVDVGSNGLSGTNDIVFTLPENARPSVNQALMLYATYNGTPGYYTFIVKTDGTLITNTGGSNFSANSTIVFSSCAYCA